MTIQDKLPEPLTENLRFTDQFDFPPWCSKSLSCQVIESTVYVYVTCIYCILSNQVYFHTIIQYSRELSDTSWTTKEIHIKSPPKLPSSLVEDSKSDFVVLHSSLVNSKLANCNECKLVALGKYLKFLFNCQFGNPFLLNWSKIFFLFLVLLIFVCLCTPISSFTGN